MKKFVMLLLALLSCIVCLRAEEPEKNRREYLVNYYDKADSTKIAVIYRDDVVREKVSMLGYVTLKGSFEDYGYGNKYLFIRVDKDKFEKVNKHLRHELEGYASLTKVFLPEHYEFYRQVNYFPRPFIRVTVITEEDYTMVERACEYFRLSLYKIGGYPYVESRSTSDDEEFVWGEDYNMAIDPALGIDPLEILFALADIDGFPDIQMEDGDYGFELGSLDKSYPDSRREMEISAGVVQSPQQVRVTGVSGVSFIARAGFDLNTLSPGVYIISAPGCKPMKFVVR